MKIAGFLLCTVLLALKVNGECPAIHDLPVYYDDNTFNCARFYYGWGNDLALHGCNGCSVQNFADLPHGLDSDAGEGKIYPMGSALVKAGCILYVFHDNNYGGSWDIYEGPGTWSNIRSGQGSADDGCADGNPGIICRCGMRTISCLPEDRYDVVLRCDATNSIENTECNYMKTIGTKYMDKYSQSMSIDATIKAEMTEKFFEVFSATIGVSVSTGYNWGEVSSEIMSEEDKFQILAEAPAGYVLTIEQAVGHCDGNTVKTELFKITHTNAEGKIVKTEYQKSFLNGTTITLKN